MQRLFFLPDNHDNISHNNMAEYNPKKIEEKWQKKFEDSDFFKAQSNSKKKKFYVLVEFPYPSGAGLHVGHCRSYVAMDIIARKRRMEGYNVLFPIGWDAFGLPTENYAIKTGVHPAVATKNNTDNFRRQLKILGFSFDWSREVNTTDPRYYKWTQWIFIQLFNNGLAYKAKMAVNWCPDCKIVLANEEVVDGKCERCGTPVEKREKEQWLLKITKYADRLADDLNTVDYPERVKKSQIDWIGKSSGWEIKFKLSHSPSAVFVFTTRIDTIFGATYMVLAPEHPLVEKYKNQISNYDEVEKYATGAKNKSERERVSELKDKTGVELKGIKAINPATGGEMPVFIADYVLLHYGTGAVMAVPAHDQRDFDFAKKYSLKITEVIKPVGEVKGKIDAGPYEGKGILMNSGKFDGTMSEAVKEKIGKYMEGKGQASPKTYYKLRDWIFSRQHYWGEPTPMINCQKCGWQPVKEKDLPVMLPDIKEYKPIETGESPLSKLESWVKTVCPKCGGPAERETDVMPNWAGSNWYYLRYTDPKNDKKLAGEKPLKYFMPVDWYNGGMEHTTLHLLYSRFIFKFLWDIGAVPKSIGSEPYKKRTSHGIILGEGSVKMSKSKGNVVNPEDVVKKYGADTLRVYEMFMGPFEQMIPWDEKGVVGAKRFLQKVFELLIKFQTPNPKTQPNPKSQTPNSNLKSLLHKTIKKVSEDIEAMKFNTAVSSLMVLVNNFSESPQSFSKDNAKDLLLVLSPFAPHLAEELWEKAGFKGMCSNQKWPKYDAKLLKREKVLLIVQVNGRVRDKIEVEADISQKDAEKIVLESKKIKEWVFKKEIKKTVFVPNKLINFVIS